MALLFSGIPRISLLINNYYETEKNTRLLSVLKTPLNCTFIFFATHLVLVFCGNDAGDYKNYLSRFTVIIFPAAHRRSPPNVCHFIPPNGSFRDIMALLWRSAEALLPTAAVYYNKQLSCVWSWLSTVSNVLKLSAPSILQLKACFCSLFLGLLHNYSTARNYQSHSSLKI